MHVFGFQLILFSFSQHNKTDQGGDDEGGVCREARWVTRPDEVEVQDQDWAHRP